MENIEQSQQQQNQQQVKQIQKDFDQNSDISMSISAMSQKDNNILQNHQFLADSFENNTGLSNIQNTRGNNGTLIDSFSENILNSMEFQFDDIIDMNVMDSLQKQVQSDFQEIVKDFKTSCKSLKNLNSQQNLNNYQNIQNNNIYQNSLNNLPSPMFKLKINDLNSEILNEINNDYKQQQQYQIQYITPRLAKAKTDSLQFTFHKKTESQRQDEIEQNE